MASSLYHISLPFELTEEIFSAIPIEYLIRFRLICKQWYSLFKNKRFIYSYSDLTHERFIRIDTTVQIIDPVAQTRINSPLPAEFPHRPFISAMVHCDGLVLLKFNNTELGFRRLLIWNPILGQIKWIPPTSNLYGHSKSYGIYWVVRYREGRNVQTEYNREIYGIGYDNVSRDDHKILRFYNRFYEDLNKRYGDEIEIEIYDLKSNSWKYLEATSDWSLQFSCKGVSVTGNMYWVAYKSKKYDPQFFIQSFDFSTETFKPRSCLPFETQMTDVIALSCFRRDRLSLLYQFEETKKIEVWVTNKVDEEVMVWSKYLSLANPDLPLLCADQNLSNPGFFIDKNGKVFTQKLKFSQKRMVKLGFGMKKELERMGSKKKLRDQDLIHMMTLILLFSLVMFMFQVSILFLNRNSLIKGFFFLIC